MSYLGNTPTTQSFISGTDYFNGTGAQTAFTLSRTVNSVNDVEVFVNNVAQKPNNAYTISGTTLTFDQAPSVGTQNIYVRYLSTTTQTITPSQNTVSYASWNSDLQSETWAFRNRIINGAMMIDQRNAGASVTVNSTTAAYPVDRWFGRGVATAGVFTLQQISDAPAGFRNSLRATVTTTASSPSATDFYGFQQRIEGFNIADLGYGTANAQPVTVSFWVKSSVTGTFSVALSNNNDQTIPVTFVVNAANTWEQKSVTIAGTSSGTWDSTNGTGLLVQFTLGAGSSRTGTAGVWSSSFFINATGATNLMATNGATFQVTGVQLEKGSTATSFDYRPYGTELALCQRYCFANRASTSSGNYLRYGLGENDTSGNMNLFVQYPVTMRTAPSITTTGTPSNYAVYSAAVVRALTSGPIIGSDTNETSATVACITGGGLSVGGAGSLLSNNNKTSFLIYSAEL